MQRALACLGSLTLASGKVYFSETFGDGWESRWTVSKWKHSEGHSQGKWTTSAGKWFRDKQEDTGIMTGEDHKHFGISASFDSFSNAGKELIVQYQAKYKEDVNCGGGYFKLGPKMDDPTTFGENTSFYIMFGPDKCHKHKSTRLIFNYKGNNVAKRKDMPYRQDGGPQNTYNITHLYTMILRPDNTVRVEIDQVKIYENSIKKGWEVLKPREITDSEDKKPDDWADDKVIYDPKVTQPADWVTEARVVNGEHKKPANWDDDEDGKWEAPMKANPAYKGAWKGKRISNPAYKGAWEPRKIANPEFVDDDVYKYEDFGYIGFDLWQMKGGTIFDNIIITDDKAEADSFAAKWKALSESEEAQREKERLKKFRHPGEDHADHQKRQEEL